MKARALGAFFAEFLEGFTEGSTGNAEPPAIAPAVVPVDAVREAVASFLQPLIDAESAPPQDDAPGAQTLDLLFADAGREGPRDEIAEATLRRVHEVQEREAARARAERNGQVVPETYDPNDPSSAKPWQAPTLKEPL